MTEGRHPHRPCTVLIVDDDAGIRDACAEALTDEGYSVRAARDGVAGLAALDEDPDVIVLDLLMPRMDGWEFLRELRGMEAHARTPVLLLTATSSRGASLAGAQAILRKPFVLEALLRHVADLAR